jgi:hypothetical protein
MMPITTSSQLLPTGEPRFRHCTGVAPASPKPPLEPFDQAKIASSTPAATTMMAPRLSIRRQLRGQRFPYPNRRPVKSP